jgi:hypothetical protein
MTHGAERIIRQLIDDLDGTEIREGEGERVEFALGGVTYQIDLSASNVAPDLGHFWAGGLVAGR